MWVMTTTGMFSVVSYDQSRPAGASQAPDGVGLADRLVVRARAEQDILGMLDAVELPRSRAHSTPNADYPWRAILSRHEWIRFLALEVHRLDYTNFKGRVLQAQGRERHDTYMRVWSALRSIRSPREAGGTQPRLPTE